MKIQKLLACTAGLSFIIFCTGCQNTPSGEPIATMPVTEMNSVAENNETALPLEISDDGLTPIDGEMILNGVYEIAVESSSSMFQITSCKLTASMGKLTASMTMSGTGYLYLYMGTGEEAAKLSEREYIPFTENESGEHMFEIPVEALDKAITCSAFSKNKQKWYDRTLLFRADSLPLAAFDDDLVPTVSSLELEDGNYEIHVTLEGGSGRASIDSPTKLTIQDGQAMAEIKFQSPNYDYLISENEKYLSEIIENQSVFTIPVPGFNHKLAISADTTAMSKPHEIDYTLYFDAETLVKLS
ncbi:MAG: hypothetical protein K2G25_01290 [Oscillospiraceae bacterium]|nr:hypothetical protein [Oscillospiraceae bacterium]